MLQKTHYFTALRCNSILKGTQGISLLLQSCSFQTNKQTCNNICAAIDSSLSHVHIKNVYLLSHNALQCYQNFYEFAIDFFLYTNAQGPCQEFGTAIAKLASNVFSILRRTAMIKKFDIIMIAKQPAFQNYGCVVPWLTKAV